MSFDGMYMLKSPKYKEEKIHEALEILYKDRKNEFQELAQAFLAKDKLGEIPNLREFILNFCLDVSDSFKTWTNQKPPSTTSPQKALTILRQIGSGMTSMNQLTKLLDVSYNLSIEFNEIYKRIK